MIKLKRAYDVVSRADGRRFLVRVARTLLSLRGATLRDGHCICSLMWCDELACVALMLEQRAPARISRSLRAAASAFVQVGAASRAEPFAIVPALDVQRGRQQPGLSHGRPEIESSRVRIEEKHFRVVSFFGPHFSEKEVHLLAHIDIYLFQAAAAGQLYAAIHSATEIKSSIARGG